MWKPADSLPMAVEQKKTLEAWIRAKTTPQRIVLRSRICLLAAEGTSNNAIARHLETSRPTVLLWRKRFEGAGPSGLSEDAPHGPSAHRLSSQKVRAIVEATLQTTPQDATHLSTRTMAKAQVQALDRTQPGLPMKKGRCGTMTHDYKRHGTTCLFAALNVLDGTVIGTCYPRHRNEEFLKFLRTIDRDTPPGQALHLILDNYGTHNHPHVKTWLGNHPRFHLHVTPTSASWLNLVERWFGEITRKRIRRGVFHSVPELVAAIDEFILVNNENPKPFVWTKKVDAILEKLTRCKTITGTLP